MSSAGQLRDRVTFRRKIQTGTDDTYKTPIYEWRDVETVWANVRDMLPSKSESVQAEINIARQPCRILIRYRTGLDSSMRVSVNGGPELRLIAGPAQIGHRKWLEFVAEELTTEGADA